MGVSSSDTGNKGHGLKFNFDLRFAGRAQIFHNHMRCWMRLLFDQPNQWTNKRSCSSNSPPEPEAANLAQQQQTNHNNFVLIKKDQK